MKMRDRFLMLSAMVCLSSASCRSTPRKEAPNPEVTTFAKRATPEHVQPKPAPANGVTLMPAPQIQEKFESAASPEVYLMESPTSSAPRARKRGRLEGGVVGGVVGGSGSGVYDFGRRSRATDDETYDAIEENRFKTTKVDPLSTFSIDVDSASYSNVRRFINQEHRLPPKDAVRIEEMINYFTYDYPEPAPGQPFSITTEVSFAPWDRSHRLVRIGVQGKRVSTANLPPNNLVFLLDVSGSMMSADRLPLLQASFRLLVEHLRPQDRVAIVAYAGQAGLVLPSTPGNDKATILSALEGLQAGGSTAGAQGIELAYELAGQNFLRNGNNRVILATDGDFNVGVSSDTELVRLIEAKRDGGIFLTVLGVGRGNYKDSKMEKLADKGNGNAFYIDDILEAEKVLVTQMGGTLLTIAKDVKIQVEFNPLNAQAYRLVGYENRMLAREDFNDDKKDAGELGAGHSITALYEVITSHAEVKPPFPGVDPLRYQDVKASAAAKGGELFTVKLRYKDPKGGSSQLLSQTQMDNPAAIEAASTGLRFASAVAEFGLLLRGTSEPAQSSYASVLRRAQSAMGSDAQGYRADFIGLVRRTRLLAGGARTPLGAAD